MFLVQEEQTVAVVDVSFVIVEVALTDLSSELVTDTEESEESEPVVTDPEEVGSLVSTADDKVAVPVTVVVAAAACSKSAEAEAGRYQ